jgi:16S rRNA (cytosine1402-N4)-methyltransferase
MQGTKHVSVLLQESVDSLELERGAIVFDGTLGNAGHSREICARIAPTGHLIAVDLDQSAIDEAETLLKGCGAKTTITRTNFRHIDRVLEGAGVERGGLHAALFDLGLRTEQVFLSGRGFSFNEKDEPLLMTFSSSPDEGVSARDALNHWSEETLTSVLRSFGDEPKAPKIARLILKRRDSKPFETVSDLVDVINEAYGNRTFSRIHPATKTFQALRMAVNDEVGALEEALKKSFEWLRVGGVISVITFHSVEDRIVKRFSKELAHEGRAELKTKKPIRPTEEEIEENPRSRSAKLRSWKKLQA